MKTEEDEESFKLKLPLTPDPARFAAYRRRKSNQKFGFM